MAQLQYAFLATALLLTAIAVRLSRRRRAPTETRLRKWLFRGGLALTLTLAGGAWLAGGALFWFWHRSPPSPLARRLFEGVSYERSSRAEPVPLAIHRVTVDLRAPGIGPRVTPYSPTDGHMLSGATTAQFLEKERVQIAINGDFFLPWWSNTPWDFYPKPGDGVDALGLALSNGVTYGRNVTPCVTLFFMPGSRAEIASFPEGAAPVVPPGAIAAISGKPMLVEGGAISEQALGAGHGRTRHPRTAAGLDRTGHLLTLLVLDGRQPGYSEGATFEETAAILLEYGVYTAINLDGGGSSALVIEGESGAPETLSMPIHTRLPSRQRTVANHLGLTATRLGTPPEVR